MKSGMKAALGAIAVAAIAGGGWVYNDYKTWYDLGPAGVPHDFSGWMTVRYWMATQAKDPFDTAIFTGEIGKPGDTKELTVADIPKREGVRPYVAPYPVPHRQVTERSDPDVRKQLRAMFDAVLARNSDKVHWGPSHVENGNDGVLLNNPDPGNPTIVKTRVWGETAHIHLVDGSVHLVLSPSDAKLVMDQGWGEMHRMMGIRGPLTYILVYAPRNAEEIAIVEKMLQASIDYSAFTPGVASTQ